jgi:hypothetical protein
MQQQTLAEVTFEQYRKPTRRERFLSEMDRVVPWADLVATIERVYPRPRARGVPRSVSSACCACIACTSGSICQIRRLRKHCTTPAPCGNSWG